MHSAGPHLLGPRAEPLLLHLAAQFKVGSSVSCDLPFVEKAQSNFYPMEPNLTVAKRRCLRHWAAIFVSYENIKCIAAYEETFGNKMAAPMFSTLNECRL